MILNTRMYLSKGPSVLDNSKTRSLILSVSITVSLSTRQVSRTARDTASRPSSSTLCQLNDALCMQRRMAWYLGRTQCNKIQLYLFELPNSHGQIGEQVRDDIEDWLNLLHRRTYICDYIPLRPYRGTTRPGRAEGWPKVRTAGGLPPI